jgi:hypothetical protein
MSTDRPAAQLPTEIAPADRLLTAAEFHRLADVPPEVEWFANLGNAHTRRAYENAVKDFMRFAGIRRPEEFRTVTRAHPHLRSPQNAAGGQSDVQGGLLTIRA